MIKPTIADMLSILVDTLDGDSFSDIAYRCDPTTDRRWDRISDIAEQIEADHGSITYMESLALRDPFRSGVSADPITVPDGICHAPLSAIVTGLVVLTDSRVRQVIADIDAALHRLANSGYAHTI